MDLPARVTVCDVGPRDGLQNESAPVSVDDKVRLVNELIAAGVPEVEAGAFVSPKWVPQMAGSDDVFARARRSPSTKLLALIPNARGLELALAAQADGVTLVVSATDSFEKRNLNRTVAEGMAIVKELAKGGLPSSLAISVSWGCPYEGHVDPARVVELACEAFDAGVNRVSFADTTGMADPRHVAQLLELAKRHIGVERIGCHFHNTRGAGLANALAALQAGVTQLDSSIGGLGGCPFAPKATGNICTEDLVHMLHAMGIQTGISLDGLLATSAWLPNAVGHDVPSLVVKAGPAFR